MSKILVTAKVHPDLDGVACALAYSCLLQKQGRDARGLVFEEPQAEVKFFQQKCKINIPVLKDDGVGSWEEFVLVDASSMKGMPKVVLANKVTEIIDHRESQPEKEFPQAKIQNELIGAAATLVVERFVQAGLKPKPDHAKLLYGAIYHNTLNFIASNATERDQKTAHFLAEHFGLTENLVTKMFDYSSREIISDPEAAIKNDAKEFGHGYTLRAYQLIGFGLDLGNKKRKIEETIAVLDKNFGAQWSILNVVDLKIKKSTIYISNKDKMTLVEKALGYPLESQWATLPIALLRKQIMPKIQAVLNQNEN